MVCELLVVVATGKLRGGPFWVECDSFCSRGFGFELLEVSKELTCLTGNRSSTHLCEHIRGGRRGSHIEGCCEGGGSLSFSHQGRRWLQ